MSVFMVVVYMQGIVCKERERNIILHGDTVYVKFLEGLSSTAIELSIIMGSHSSATCEIWHTRAMPYVPPI